MEQPPETALIRLPRPRLAHVAWAVVLYCGIVGAVWPRRTYDIWWHLATGKLIVEQHAIPDADPFTWTRAGAPWITHEWAWEVPMYVLYAAWGHAGLMVLRTVVSVAACALLVWLCLRRGASPLATMAVCALAIFAARPLFNDRPQVVSILGFVAMLCLIQMAQEGRERFLLAAPLVMVPWVNLHGGFVFGPGLLALYAAGALVGWVLQWRDAKPLRPSPAVVLGALLLALGACLANPHGIAGAVYPLDYVIGEHAWHKTWITEYQSPDFSEPIFLWLGVLIVAMAAILAASRRGSGLWDIALTAVFLFMALKWQRNIALFAFAVAPMLAVHLTDLLERVVPAALAGPDHRREPTALYAGIMVALAVLAVLAVPSALRRVDVVFSQDYPIECVRFADREGIEGRMFNTYRWGGYLIWRLWPRQRVFIDGRADVIGREIAMDWQKAHKLEDGWQEVLERYRIDWAILSVSSPLCRALEIHPDWRLACEEPTARLYVRRGSVAEASLSEGRHTRASDLED
ncbi:MAG: hypothetical protein AB7Y46_11720 [Armatimonadota bacterium]